MSDEFVMIANKGLPLCVEQLINYFSIIDTQNNFLNFCCVTAYLTYRPFYLKSINSSKLNLFLIKFF